MKTKPKHSRRGTSIVETAIILPLLVVLTFGAIKYSWLFFKAQQVLNVTRQATRMAVRPDATDAQVRAKIATLMGDAGISDYTEPVISMAVGTGENVTVTLSVPVANVDILKLPLLPVSVEHISASLTMSKEGP
jgi:Flp pilus assembly protein TadG